MDSEQRTTNNEQCLVRLGVISGPHGVKGQVKIRSFTSHPENITAYGDLRDISGNTYRLNITGRGKDTLIASIAGITSREDAEKLRNIELYVKRGVLPEPEENEYYHDDLIGLEVFTEKNTPYGQIISINNFGAGDIVEIRLVSGEEEFQPFNKATFPVIDTKNRRLVIVPPEMAG